MIGISSATISSRRVLQRYRPFFEDFLAGRLHLAVLAAFVVVLTGHTILSRWTAPVFDDVAEAWSWGRQLELGYYKHPPFYAYVARLWFEIAGRHDATAYLLAALNSAVGMLGIYQFSRRFVDDRGALLAVLAAMLLPQHTVMATNFNANTILLSLWPWTAFAFLRALETGRARHGALFGLLAAASLLSKYTSVLLLVACLAAALQRSDRKAIFASPAPYVAVVVMCLAVAPHGFWLWINDFPPIDWATRRAGDPLDTKLSKGVTTFLAFMALLAPMLIGLRLAAGRRADARAKAIVDLSKDPRMATLMLIALGPLALTALAGFSGLTLLQTNYLIPMAFALPTLLVALLGTEVRSGSLMRMGRLVLVCAAGLLVSSPIIAYALQFKEINHTTNPTSRAARIAANLWHERVGTPVRLVAGTEVYSLGLVFYGRDRPAEFTHFNFKQAPWVTPERIKQQGLLVVCIAEDRRCISSAEPYTNAATERVDQEVSVRHLGFEVGRRKLRIFIIPPASKV